MKNGIITSLLLILFSAGFSQGLQYGVRGTYSHPLTKEKLIEVKSMADIIPYYPSSWILSYVSVEIMAICSGKEMRAKSSNDALSLEQKNILKSSDLGTDIVINIDYNYGNPATDSIEINTLYYTASLIPEREAEFPHGQEQLTKYLKEKAISKISESAIKKIQQTTIKFTITEKGKIANAQITKTSGDSDIDKILLKAINKMPKWKPAENAKGIKVKQEFQFSVGNNSGC